MMMKSKGKYALLRQAPRVAVLLIAMLPLQLQARGGYQISLQIKGGTDTLLYLGYYYAQNRYLLDSALCDRRGRFFFGGDRSLPDGLYFFSNREGRKMDFVIYHEKPQFTFRTDERDWERNMEVSGSKQNTVFFNFHRRMEALYDEMREGEANIDSAQLPAYRHAFYLRIDTLRLQTIEQHPEAMLSRLMMATKDPAAPPDSLTGNDRYFYVMHHFFDNVPLEEDFIVRTPREVFYERLTEYVDKRMRGLTPELAIPLLDSLIERAAPSEETFKYLVHTLTERYLQSTVMVYDEIYVHLVDRYWATGRATWHPPFATPHAWPLHAAPFLESHLRPLPRHHSRTLYQVHRASRATGYACLRHPLRARRCHHPQVASLPQRPPYRQPPMDQPQRSSSQRRLARSLRHHLHSTDLPYR